MGISKYFVSLIFCTNSLLMFSQEITTVEHVEMGGFVDQQTIEMIGEQFNPPPRVSEKNYLETNISLTGNNVFISQIGRNNTVNTKILAETSNTTLKQKGNNNDIHIELNAEEIEYNLSQTGDHNYFYHSINTSYQPINVNFTQDGNNNHIEKYGSNSITNKLEFNIKGNSKALIIRSYQ